MKVLRSVETSVIYQSPQYNIRPRTDLSILPQRNCVMQQGFASVDDVAVPIVVFDSLRGLIHLAVGFPARIKGCYVTPLHQVRTCFCARYDLRIQLIVGCIQARLGFFLMPSSSWDARNIKVNCFVEVCLRLTHMR